MIKLSIYLIFSVAIVNLTLANENVNLKTDFEVIYSKRCDQEFCPHKPFNRADCDLGESIVAFKKKVQVQTKESLEMTSMPDSPYLKTTRYHLRLDKTWNLRLRENMQFMIEGEVNCGIRYIDREKIRYTMKTFLHPYETWKFGYQPTHYGRCGVCSSLQDLTIYLRSNFTLLARQCFFESFASVSDRLSFKCYERLGLTESCARLWTYRSTNTIMNCYKIKTCLADYNWSIWFKSLYARLTSWFFNEWSNPIDRKWWMMVEPVFYSCSQCDEYHSALLFKYNAGRTQENSKGINHCYY